MKKTFLTFGACLAVVCGTFAYAATGNGPLAQLVKNALPTESQKTSEEGEQKIKLDRGLTIDAAEIERASSMVPATNSRLKTEEEESNSGYHWETSDYWGRSTIYNFNTEEAYDVESNTFTFPVTEESSQELFTGLTSDLNSYDWYWVAGWDYKFSANLTSDGDLTVKPCVCYRNDNGIYIYYQTEVVLNEENGYTADFELEAQWNGSRYPLILAYLISGSETATTLVSTDNSLSARYYTANAQAWDAETGLPDLGLEQFTDNTYTVMCDDGLTTIGLYLYNGYVYVTGINTTAEEVTIPKFVIIDGLNYYISEFAVDGCPFGWSGAPNLKTLDARVISRFYETFETSPITDLYIKSNAEIYYTSPSFENIYLHIPYGASRSNYNNLGFKRVLIGEEQSYYPVADLSSDWVIAGEEEGDYFAITLYNNIPAISQIFTDKESITLPQFTPWSDALYYIRRFGVDSNYYWMLCSHAPNLKSVTIPASYTAMDVNWDIHDIVDLHMQGNLPSTYWQLPSKMTVYVAEQAYFGNYESDYNWNQASIVPDGWEFEWMDINVGRKGEFAQTYIEQTDGDWSIGQYVRVTGKLNNTDLTNIKNLTNLRKLDLSGAEFDALPQYFMQNKSTLQEVILPESLTELPFCSFEYCRSLSSVTAPGVTTLADNVFYQCSKLKTFDTSKLEKIGVYAFRSCTAFKPNDISSVKSIGESAFYGTAIEEANLSEGLVAIPATAFRDCNKLASVTLPSTLRTIGNDAFYNCSSLPEIEIPQGVTSIGNYAFNGCHALTSVVIPEGVYSIGNYIFKYCIGLETLSLPSTLSSIGYGAFSNASALKEVKCKAIVPPAATNSFTDGMDLTHCTLYVAPFAIDAYRNYDYWKEFYIMKPLNEPVEYISIVRPMSFDLLSEDNAVLQNNPFLEMAWSDARNNKVGQLSATGDGTLSAGNFWTEQFFYVRSNTSYYDIRPSLINDAENMRADNVVNRIRFEKNRWHFISFPHDVQMSNIYPLNGTDFVIRQYNSQNRASGDGTTSNWENVPADGMLKAGQGYAIQAANNIYDENGYSYYAMVQFESKNSTTKNNLFTSNNVIVPLEEYPAEFAHNRSWNLVGNPYPCYYDMHYLMDDFSSPIVLWRGTSYQAYSPVDDDIILKPNESFFVQRPLDAEQIVFGVDGRMHWGEAYNANVNPGIRTAPARSRQLENRYVFNFNMTGAETDDRARIVMNEEADMAYEQNRDACKFFAETAEGVEIFVNGVVKYDICERPLEDATAALGIRVAKDGECTISLTGKNTEGWSVILTDTETGASIDLTQNAYTFEAQAGTYDNRFLVTFKAPNGSAVEGLEAAGEANVTIFDTTGLKVFEGNLNDFKAAGEKGVYIVLDGDKTYKIAVK